MKQQKLLLHGLELDSDWNLIMFVAEELEQLNFPNRFGAKDYFNLSFNKIATYWNARFVGTIFKDEEEAVITNCATRKEAVVKSIKLFIEIYETGKRKTNEVNAIETPKAENFLKNK